MVIFGKMFFIKSYGIVAVSYLLWRTKSSHL